jgi:hypothetical protein
MNPSSRFPLLLTLLCFAVLALPAWAAGPPAAPASPVALAAPAGQCGATAAPVCRAANAAPPAEGLAPAGPQDVPFTDYSPDFLPVGPVFVSWIGDCCTGGASLCACVNGYLRHCGSPQCDTGTYYSCLYLPCSTCHC